MPACCRAICRPWTAHDKSADETSEHNGAAAAVSVELHLPDLPEVPLSLGPDPARRQQPAQPWSARVHEALASSLPLVLMALLVLATGWLVKNSPRPGAAPGERPVSAEPDYQMSQFALERFDAAGRLKLRIEGAQMRHFPASDRMEVDHAQITAYAPDGRVTEARAQRALGNGDGSEMQLVGGAEVSSRDAAGRQLLMRGEFLHAFLVLEQVKSHLPVQVWHGATALRGSGLFYDHAASRLELIGRVNTVLQPRVDGVDSKAVLPVPPAAPTPPATLAPPMAAVPAKS